MSLGVLNNLNAMYAANNLNNTSNSLSNVLQQLSSGSKINSGADDAAGLSLVNGLQANAQALSQSQTNASQGVGLLKVADGALSQVTNLLNRAVTLATEASNGTLSSSQDTAANNEYQSILSEINNIGSTTTYNGQTVFGSKTDIYTGDSSSAGASINSLNIRSLSSSNVGDSNGSMSYSSGVNNVFIDLSNAGQNAAVTDTLGTSSATTKITVSYMTKGTDGSAVSASADISVGAGTSYANTAQGLISAINGSGLGLTASFGTAAQAGSTAVSAAQAANDGNGGATDTGIIISGIGVGTGTNKAGEVGKLSAGGNTDLLGGTLNIVGSDGASHSIDLGKANSTDTLQNLATTINGANYGVTATYDSTNHDISFTSANSAVTVTGTNLTDRTSIATSDTSYSLTAGTVDTTADLSGAGANALGSIVVGAATSLLSGKISLTDTDGTTTTPITLGTAGQTDTLANLTNYINTLNVAGATGITAALDSDGTTMTLTVAAGTGTAKFADGTSTDKSAATIPAVTVSTSLTDTPKVSGQFSSQVGALKISGAGSSATDTFTANTGTLTLGSNTINMGVSGKTDTLQNLAATVNAGNYGVTATYDATNAQVVFTSTNSSMVVSESGIKDVATGTTTPVAASNSAVDASQYYSVNVTGTVKDTSTTATINSTTTYGGTANTGIVANSNGSGGVATISYSDGAGQSLSATDLSNQTDAKAALTALNAAITAVAAQDGYIGAQINTLNAVSSVLSTQQQNVTAAQNAVQATDYATAASNMSKYQILSQTGISALAQANSMQQEVTKLLQ